MPVLMLMRRAVVLGIRRAHSAVQMPVAVHIRARVSMAVVFRG